MTALASEAPRTRVDDLVREGVGVGVLVCGAIRCDKYISHIASVFRRPLGKQLLSIFKGHRARIFVDLNREAQRLDVHCFIGDDGREIDSHAWWSGL